MLPAIYTTRQVNRMKSMIWHPEAKDEKVNQYLSQVNHAPYEIIIGLVLGGICLVTAVFLLGLY